MKPTKKQIKEQLKLFYSDCIAEKAFVSARLTLRLLRGKSIFISDFNDAAYDSGLVDVIYALRIDRAQRVNGFYAHI